jgi:dUTP pyrophosphatase
MAGVVDSSYRGEIKVVILNVGSKPLEIKKGMKIAQMLIQPIEIAEIIDADNLNETDRGDRGFGSTGTGIG